MILCFSSLDKSIFISSLYQSVCASTIKTVTVNEVDHLVAARALCAPSTWGATPSLLLGIQRHLLERMLLTDERLKQMLIFLSPNDSSSPQESDRPKESLSAA